MCKQVKYVMRVWIKSGTYMYNSYTIIIMLKVSHLQHHGRRIEDVKLSQINQKKMEKQQIILLTWIYSKIKQPLEPVVELSFG